VEVGSIATGKPAPEFNAARNDYDIIYIGGQGSDFLGADGFKARWGCGKKSVFLGDDMSLDPLVDGGVQGHPGPF
jgi:hypothetical protein